MTSKRRRRRSPQPVEALEPRVLLSAANQQTWRATEQPQGYIVNGTETNDYKGVGIVNDFCTGTLITPTHVLTAAHCTVDLDDDEGYFKVGRKRYDSLRITEHFNYDDNNFSDGYDLAIMELTKPVKNVTPYELHTEAPEVGQIVTLVGYGRAGTTQQGELFPFGTKREANTRIDEVNPRHIRWTIDTHQDGSNSFGDSGGPAFLDVDGDLKIVGVTSGGNGSPYTLGSTAFDNRVDVFMDWIEANTVIRTDVRATFSNGSVTLKGDAGDNSVVVTGNTIVGIDGTQINGEGFVFIPGGAITGNLTMQFTKGDNKVAVAQPVAGNVTYKGGKGRDGLSLTNDVEGNVSIKTGGGLDAVELDGLTVDGDLVVNTGGGRDKIYFTELDVLGSTNVVTGNGNDEMYLELSEVEDFALKLGGGNDFFAVTTTQVNGRMNANLGGGNDGMYAEALALAGADSSVLNGGGGTDSLQESNNTYAVLPTISSMEDDTVSNVFGRIIDLLDCMDDLVL